jgi:hypothetical protein
MGQVTNPSLPGWTILAIDREYAPGAGPGASGNFVVMVGLNAGKNSSIANSIVIGNQTANAGITDASLNGSTIVGAQSLQSLTASTSQWPAAVSGLTVIGQNNLNLAQKADSSVVIGEDILPLLVSSQVNSGLQASVIIGNGIGPGVNSLVNGYSQCVVIGFQACPVQTFASTTGSVFIGSGVCPHATGSNQSSVIIGQAADIGLNTAQSVVIGTTASVSVAGSTSGNVVIGYLANGGAGQDVTVVGSNAGSGNVAAGSILMGRFAGKNIPAATPGAFCVENNNAAANAVLYGNLLNGNLLVGNSVDGTNRDLIAGGAATNILKMLNGTKGGANPVGGGYFYNVGGFLHWVDTAGVDTQLSVTAAGQLAANALVAYSNNAAAAVGTLTNAPVAGNPTKWIPINDNGTVRNLPVW